MSHAWRRALLLFWVLLFGVPCSIADHPNVPPPSSLTQTDQETDRSTTTTTTTRPSAKDPPDEEDAKGSPGRHPIELTSKNFAKEINDGNVWLIEFYSPSCRHCREFSRSYDHIAANFHLPSNQGFRVGKVDCATELALKTRFGIRFLPTFFVVDGWSVYEFDKIRTEAALMDFLRGGYKKQDPLPLYTSPMGPMGLLQGTMMYIGALVMNIFEWIQNAGVPPLVAGIVLSFVAVVGGMISVVLLAIMTTPKAKND